MHVAGLQGSGWNGSVLYKEVVQTAQYVLQLQHDGF
jgi:hypothetical protein